MKSCRYRRALQHDKYYLIISVKEVGFDEAEERSKVRYKFLTPQNYIAWIRYLQPRKQPLKKLRIPMALASKNASATDAAAWKSGFQGRYEEEISLSQSEYRTSSACFACSFASFEAAPGTAT